MFIIPIPPKLGIFTPKFCMFGLSDELKLKGQADCPLTPL